MKKTILKLTTILLLFIFSSCSDDDDVNVTGSGNIITEERNIDSFNEVNSPSSINVTILFGNDQNIEVSADDNIINFVETTVINDILIVDLKSGNYNNITVNVTLTIPNLTALTNSGSGNMTSAGFTDLTNLEIQNSGSGSIELSGSSTAIDILNSGSGEVKAFNFIVDNCELDNSGSGNSEVFCNDTLSGMLSGSGDVLYRGTPNLTIADTGSGSIVNVN